jgi:tetratricopeptide (TPR) repeat protein
MTKRILLLTSALSLASICGFGQSGYVPGVTYQTDNPNYFQRNPFYFEGRVDWELLKIDQPSTPWEFLQRGIHRQDDLEDNAGAIKDYRQSIALNNLDNGTCQLVTSANVAQVATGKMDPAPCMFTPRLRLAGLLRDTDPAAAVELYEEALNIDPLRLAVHQAIAETYLRQAERTTNTADEDVLLEKAVEEFQAEVALSPVTALQVQVTGDEANNAHSHWALAEIYAKLGKTTDEMRELDLYLKATKWHSDTYPWRIQLAQKRMEQAAQKAGSISSVANGK